MNFIAGHSGFFPSVFSLVRSVAGLLTQVWPFLLAALALAAVPMLIEVLTSALLGPPAKQARGKAWGQKTSPRPRAAAAKGRPRARTQGAPAKSRSPYAYRPARLDADGKARAKMEYQARRDAFDRENLKAAGTPEYWRRRRDFEVALSREGLQAWRTETEWDRYIGRVRETASQTTGARTRPR